MEKESSPEKVKSRGQRQRSARNTSAHVATDVWLYDAFFGAGSSVKMLVTDWLEMWNTDKNKGMLDLVEMLFLVSFILSTLLIRSIDQLFRHAILKRISMLKLCLIPT